MKTGEEVAVKIQYPNMIRTIRSDMRNRGPALDLDDALRVVRMDGEEGM